MKSNAELDAKSNELIAEAVRVLRLEAQAIQSCASQLENRGECFGQNFDRGVQILFQSLEKGGKIIVTGIGKSGKVGQKIAATLCSTGSLAVFIHATEGLHGDLGLVRPEDSILALSHTGNSEEIIRLLPTFKRLGISVVGVGGNAQSQLAKECNAWIDSSVEQEACPHNLAPTTSTTLALALGDAIAVTLMKLRKFDVHAFANNHPGGSLGRKLNLTVADLMHSGKSVATVGPDASMDQVIVEATHKKLGAVLVVQGSRLLGIVTDGDIRRALQKKEKFFELLASDIMNSNPTKATPEMMASTALKLMEDRPSQISVLPVVDANENWKGLLRLHDLVRSF